MSLPARGSPLLLRLWVLSLSTFVLTALIAVTVPDLFFRSPLEEARAQQVALHVEQLEASVDDPSRLRERVQQLHEYDALELEVRAGEQLLATTGSAPVGGLHHRVLREAREGQPEIVAVYSIPRPPLPPIDGRHLAATLALMALGGLAHALVLRKLVARPLTRLTAAAETFAAGRLDARVDLSGSDEFAEVARAFDDMAERIEGFVAAQRELLANVSHELRTPLARVRVVLDTFEATGDVTMLAELHEEFDELQGLVEALFDAVSLEVDDERPGLLRGAFAAVDPQELLELVARRFERAHPERVLQTDWESSLPPLHADFDGLARVLDNLLDNAAKYSPPEEPLGLRAARAENQLELAVIDRGMGIAAADLPHVFEPFFRAERSRCREAGGAGLGLAIVARVIDRHGGRIELRSTPQPLDGARGVEHGTTVRIRLPLAPRGG